MSDKIKAGYKTSEFWIALVALVVPVVVHLGWLTPAEATNINETAAEGITNLFNLIGVFVPAAYVIGRSYLKKSA